MGTNLFLYSSIGLAAVYYFYTIVKFKPYTKWTQLHYARKADYKHKQTAKATPRSLTYMLMQAQAFLSMFVWWFTNPKAKSQKLNYQWATGSSKSISRKHFVVIFITLLYIPLTRIHKELPVFSIPEYANSWTFVFFIAKAINFLLLTYILWLFTNVPFQKSFKNLIITIWLGYGIGEIFLTLPLWSTLHFGSKYLLGIFFAPAVVLLSTRSKHWLTQRHKKKAIQYDQAKKIIDQLTENELKNISAQAMYLQTLPELLNNPEDFELLNEEILKHSHTLIEELRRVEIQIKICNLKTINNA